MRIFRHFSLHFVCSHRYRHDSSRRAWQRRRCSTAATPGCATTPTPLRSATGRRVTTLTPPRLASPTASSGGCRNWARSEQALCARGRDDSRTCLTSAISWTTSVRCSSTRPSSKSWGRHKQDVIRRVTVYKYSYVLLCTYNFALEYLLRLNSNSMRQCMKIKPYVGITSRQKNGFQQKQ